MAISSAVGPFSWSLSARSGLALLAALVLAGLLRGGNTGDLTLATRLLLHLGNAQQDGGQHLVDCAVEVDMLGDGHDAQSAFALVAEGIKPLAEISGKAVQLVEHDGADLAREHVRLELLEAGAIKVVARLLVSVPSNALRLNAVARQSILDFRALAG